MPYAITTFGRGTGYARYQAGPQEEFTVLAASFVFEARHNNQPYGYPIVEYRDAAGGLIYRQVMNDLLKGLVGVSMAAGAEPFYVSNAGPFGFPQANEQQFNATMSLRLPTLTLTPGGTFGIYVTQFALNQNDDPMPWLSPDFNVTFPHLWVEDTPASRSFESDPRTPLGPYMLVGGPSA